MTEPEFVQEMRALEFNKRVTKDQAASRRDRWKALYRILRAYSQPVWQEAVNRLLSSGDGFLPPSDEIVETCDDVEQDLKPKKLPPSPKFPVVHHTCSKQPEICEAVRWISLAMPEEAKHLYCPGAIDATCPNCGAQHHVPGNFTAVFEATGDDPAGINDCVKGYTLCPACEPLFK